MSINQTTPHFPQGYSATWGVKLQRGNEHLKVLSCGQFLPTNFYRSLPCLPLKIDTTYCDGWISTLATVSG